MIHIFREKWGGWQVWTDTSVGEMDGRCLATGKTRLSALTRARTALEGELRAVNRNLNYIPPTPERKHGNSSKRKTIQ